jgi:hypothetical protein
MPPRNGGLRLSAAAVSIIGSIVLGCLGTIFAGTYTYIVSKTQMQSNQDMMSRELTEIRRRLDSQAETMNQIGNRMIKQEDATETIKQTLGRLELSLVQKR